MKINMKTAIEQLMQMTIGEINQLEESKRLLGEVIDDMKQRNRILENKELNAEDILNDLN